VTFREPHDEAIRQVADGLAELVGTGAPRPAVRCARTAGGGPRALEVLRRPATPGRPPADGRRHDATATDAAAQQPPPS
jgi:hypothetical protein